VEDAFSKWIEVFVVNSTGAQCAINKFRELFSRFGLPEYLETDNGPPFTSDLFQQYLKLNGVVYGTSSPYYPQSNGQAESEVKIIKTFLLKIKMVDVEKRLSQFLFDYRIAMHSTTHETPAKLLIGRIPRSRFDMLKPNVRKIVEINQEKQSLGKKGITRQLKNNESVVIRNYKGNNKKWMKGVVKQREGSVIYIVELENGVICKRHIDQIIKLDESELSRKK